MKIVQRKALKNIIDNIGSGKVLIILGARRTGKTTLLKEVQKRTSEPVLFLNGEDEAAAVLLQRRSIQNYRNIMGNTRFLIIDEAQKIENIGQILKLMIDEIEELKILITGSSAFDISNKTGEPLTGRKLSFMLFPFAENEFTQTENILQRRDNLNQRLVYGNYPELIHFDNNEQKSLYLKELVNSYLLKDILSFETIRNSSKILNILKLIAFQVGSEVSYQEIGKQLSMSKNTVEKYLDLLSKVFVLFRLDGFSRNLRKEISKSSKWYFYDNGIRNVLINNLNDVSLRNDCGILWENYMISERIKHQNYNNMLVSNYFWRTYDQQEIDLIEERDGKLYAFEFKWNPRKKAKFPKAFRENYTNSEFHVITPENYFEFLVGID